jgi:hypothetical protein
MACFENKSGNGKLETTTNARTLNTIEFIHSAIQADLSVAGYIQKCPFFAQIDVPQSQICLK